MIVPADRTRETAGRLVAAAARVERQASTTADHRDRLRLRGHALILRGSAWRLYAESDRKSTR